MASTKKESKGKMIERLWSKIKRDKQEKDWVVCDAVPPDFNEENRGNKKQEKSEMFEPSKNVFNENLNNTTDEQTSADEGEKGESEEDSSNMKEEKTRKSEQKKNKRSSDPTNEIKVCNLTIENSTVQIGHTNIKTYNYNWQQFNNNTGKCKNEDKMKKTKITRPIQAVLDSSVELESSHIQHLSKHFGNSYREIGLKLHLTNGYIDVLENRHEKDIIEISFEMLEEWKRNKGDKATVGCLCTKLWKSEITNAREAVRQFTKEFVKNKFN